MNIKKLEWEKKYSVGVAELDQQHQFMFKTINELFEAINTNTSSDNLGKIIEALVNYKMLHFETEEKYFKEFNYEGAAEHIARHKEFNEKLTSLRNKYPDYTIEFAFGLVDFLENWLVEHLMNEDQKYKDCFKKNGLK
jgi:hemerythrin-like metal-binding protein